MKQRHFFLLVVKLTSSETVDLKPNWNVLLSCRILTHCGISSSSKRSPCMLSEWVCPTGSAQEGISSREATERSSSETAGGGLRSDSTFLITLGLSTSSWTDDRATDTKNNKYNKKRVCKKKKECNHSVCKCSYPRCDPVSSLSLHMFETFALEWICSSVFQ